VFFLTSLSKEIVLPYLLKNAPPFFFGNEAPAIAYTINHRFVEKCKYPKDGSPPKSLRYIGR